MPYDSNANYSLPVGSTASTGQTILASQHNIPLEDIAAALSLVLLRDGRAPMTGALNMNSFQVTGLGSGTLTTDAATVGQVQASTPVGALVLYAGSAAPTGWLLCYGQAVSRVTYATLFAAIGTTYGTGDGSTTFNVPDMRGRIGAGKDNMGGTSASRLTETVLGENPANLGAKGGSQSHTLTTAQIPSHTHSFSGTTNTTGAHTHGIKLLSSGGGGTSGSIATSGVDSGTQSTSNGDHSHTFSGTTGSAGSGEAHNNLQPTMIFNIIIKATY